MPSTAPVLTRARTARWTVPVLVAIGVLAFAARLQMAVRGGGLLGVGAYDDGVHYAAAASLLHGRLPYRDFLFLQPPGMVLATTPFAGLGGLLGDPAGLRAFRVAFQLVGAANAVLVALALRRWGLPAVLTGGIGYALFFPAVYDERTALLEPAGTTAILVALLLTGRRSGARAQVVAGIALGVACGFKIWYVVPAVVVLAFAQGGRPRVLAGAVVAGLLVYLPFFAAAPAAMWQQVVLAQAGRARASDDAFLDRARVLLGTTDVHAQTPVAGLDPAVVTIVLLVLTAAAAVVALLTPGARALVALLVADGAVLQASPSFFAHYAALTAPALMLLLGVAAGRLVPLLPGRPLRVLAVGLVLAGVVALNLRHDLEPVDTRPPGAAGCPLRPDVGGYSFGPERLVVDDRVVGRRDNPGYQRSTVDYLLDSGAFIRWRGNTALNAASLARLREQPVLARYGTWTIRQGLGAR